MESMQALLASHGRTRFATVPAPVLLGSDDVLIRVRAAGLCRTDLYIAKGLLPARDPVVLGHEFAGSVVSVGSAVRGLHTGCRVTVMPFFPCGECESCLGAQSHLCEHMEMLGMDRDGAFAEYVVVPAAAVFPIPHELPWMTAAFAEPVAAALGVLNSSIRPGQRGAIVGSNRFAVLVRRVLEAAGFGSLDLLEMNAPSMNGTFDFVIECAADSILIDLALRSLKPRGSLILKSRSPRPLAISPLLIVKRELRIEGTHYGPFTQALELLASGKLEVGDLCGKAHTLGDFELAFDEAYHAETAKHFFTFE